MGFAEQVSAESKRGNRVISLALGCSPSSSGAAIHEMAGVGDRALRSALTSVQAPGWHSPLQMLQSPVCCCDLT